MKWTAPKPFAIEHARIERPMRAKAKAFGAERIQQLLADEKFQRPKPKRSAFAHDITAEEFSRNGR